MEESREREDLIALATAAFLAQREVFGNLSTEDAGVQNIISLAISKRVRLFCVRGEDIHHYAAVTSNELTRGRFAGGGIELEFPGTSTPPLRGLVIRRADLRHAYAALRAYAEETGFKPPGT